jgi:predicted DNA-binding ribbon-helix-helix protein
MAYPSSSVNAPLSSEKIMSIQGETASKPKLSTLTTPRAKSSLVSRNVTIAGHRTSVRLEPEMWNALSEICRRECATSHEICTVVSMHKPSGTSLTAAIRVFVMAYFRAASTEEGHNRAGHGPGGQMMMSMMQAKDKK